MKKGQILNVSATDDYFSLAMVKEVLHFQNS